MDFQDKEGAPASRVKLGEMVAMATREILAPRATLPSEVRPGALEVWEARAALAAWAPTVVLPAVVAGTAELAAWAVGPALAALAERVAMVEKAEREDASMAAGQGANPVWLVKMEKTAEREKQERTDQTVRSELRA